MKPTDKPMSLRKQIITFFLIALLASAGVCYFVTRAGEHIVSRYYVGSSAQQKRIERFVEAFKEYVSENEIGINDKEKIADWSEKHTSVYLSLYNNSVLVYEAGLTDEAFVENGKRETAPDSVMSFDAQKNAYENIWGEWLYNVDFRDETGMISIIDLSDTAFYAAAVFIGVICAFLVFIIAVAVFGHNLTKRISIISAAVSRIEKGELGAVVSLKGHDELSVLADNIDKMRSSIVERLENEQLAQKANYDLITAMSHDIRTPLTALLGYVDIMESELDPSDARMGKYLAGVKSKSLQLKQLSDKLFEYFILFGKSKDRDNVTSTQASLFLNQLLSEQIISIEDAGFSVIYKEDDTSQQGFIMAEITDITRIFDNVFSNILKYADKEKDVSVQWKKFEDKTVVVVSNYISQNASREKSTKIGLKTCAALAQKHGGTFEIEEGEDYFSVCISLPISFI